MTSCPVCNKPVDPIRARYVAVRGGKVTAYCSPECRDAETSQPTKLPEPAPAPKPAEAKPAEPPKPKTPPKGTPKTLDDLDSGPVIEIVHEPASGVVTSAARPVKPPVKQDEPLVIEPTKPRRDGSKASGGADSAAVSGEVTEAPKRARTRPSGKHLTGERTDSTEARAGWDWLEDEPAEHARPGTVTESERKAARWPFVLLFVLAALGGGGYLVMKYVVKKDAKPHDTTGAVVGSASGVVEVSADAPDAPADAAAAAEPITKEAALRQATDLLRKHIAEGTTRVQRLAAGALGRTGDPAAVAALQQGVKQEKVAATRFKLAYELARAGDKAGRDALAAGLGAPERSDKLDAATRLAWLGDERAKPLLSSLLDVAQHKLRAAEELSRLADPAATKLLEQVRTDPASSVDEKATATLALFRTRTSQAERDALAADVKKLLENESWRAFAAYALAEAKDASVRPLLVEQVKHGVGVRVRAAWALAKLGGDPSDVLPALVEVLASEKDQEQISAAEAILILAGEPPWSRYP